MNTSSNTTTPDPIHLTGIGPSKTGESSGTSIVASRLVLRMPTQSDIHDIQRLANNPHIHAMTARIPYPYTLDDAQAFVEHITSNADEQAYAICRDGALVGMIGTMFRKNNEIEIGFWIGEPYWGAGYASEAVAALILHLNANFRGQTIVAQALTHNMASKRVLERNGFSHTHTVRDNCGQHKGVDIDQFIWTKPDATTKEGSGGDQ